VITAAIKLLSNNKHHDGVHFFKESAAKQLSLARLKNDGRKPLFSSLKPENKQ